MAVRSLNEVPDTSDAQPIPEYPVERPGRQLDWSTSAPAVSFGALLTAGIARSSGVDLYFRGIRAIQASLERRNRCR